MNGPMDWMRDEMMHMAISRPTSFFTIKGVTDVDPKDALAELKEKDPDAYANLTEHLVLPEEWLP